MADVDGVDEGVAHETADQADDAVGREDAGGRKRISGGGGALDVVQSLDQIVDAERNGRHEDDPEIFEPGEGMGDRRQRNREAEMEKDCCSFARLRPP